MNFEFFYPGFTRKAITFTMDDGNFPYDRKFIEIVKPHGITGAFNLMGTERQGELTDEEYIEFYRGFEIANHCRRHPKVILPSDSYIISEDAFDMATSDTSLLYRTDTEGLFYKYYNSWWGYIATPETYIKLIDEGKRELDALFGKENVKGFVWPFCRQEYDELHEHLVAAGYTSVRRTGEVGFDIPENKMDWSYNAIHTDIMERAAEFEAIADDGVLRFFCFGVHPIDFERANCWDSLRRFAEEYGNRPDEFWYATPTEIFKYADAAGLVESDGDSVKNNSSETVYIKINNKKIILAPSEKIMI